MPKITIRNPVLGGVADSRYLGISNSLARIVGIDLHSEPGIIKVNQRLKKESGTTVTEFVKQTVVCSNGEVYFFSADSGKVWRRNSSGAYDLCYTTVPSAGSAACRGAIEYQGYVIWATQNRLHRISVLNSTSSWSTNAEPNWQTFSNGDLLFHPMAEQNLVLYIGDANRLASWDGSAFVANALDIKTPLRISALGKEQGSTDLIIGTYISGNVNDTELIRWNTWSPSFSVFDSIPELGVNGFLATDNMVLVSAGTKGNVYMYSGSQAGRYKRIPGNHTKTNACTVNPDASANMFGLPLFGVSNSVGNPVDCGIWSIGSYGREYPTVLNLEYPISTGKLASVEIGSVAVMGDYLLVTWKDSSGSTAYGVDIIDFSNKQGALTADGAAVAGAFFDTRVIDDDREDQKDAKVTVAYRSLPTGTSIREYYRLNGGSWTELTMTVDADRNVCYGSAGVPKANTVEFRTVLVASADSSPEVESVIIEF